MTTDSLELILDSLFEGVYRVDPDRKVTFWNRAAEEITGFTQEDVVTRHCGDGMLCHVSPEGEDLCAGGCPFHPALSAGEPLTRSAYLRHRDGHRIPVNIRVVALRDDDGRVTGALQFFRPAVKDDEKDLRLKELERLAYIDALTELPNRRFIEATIESRLNELRRFHWRFGVIFIDVDNFKMVNDQRGHDAGDRVLKMVAACLRECGRGTDVFGRLGGEEFIGIIANADREALRTVADRIRVLVESSRLNDGSPLTVTVSVGVAEAAAEDTVMSLLQRADRHLYHAKKTGRNRVAG